MVWSTVGALLLPRWSLRGSRKGVVVLRKKKSPFRNKADGRGTSPRKDKNKGAKGGKTDFALGGRKEEKRIRTEGRRTSQKITVEKSQRPKKKPSCAAAWCKK